ncbi:MAG TPA: hypothetical protein VHB49_12375 [Bradyrhizobium sp.]|nr:hypothetical protein [Bradyrhizobium sp.]
MIHSISSFLFRLFNVLEWHDIATAPFHQEIELAIIDDKVTMSALTYLREASGWLDAETLRPVSVTATHWRYRQPVAAPSCC